MKLVLKDNTTYQVCDKTTEREVIIQVDFSSVETIKNTLTDKNLSSFKFTTDGGTLLSEFKDKTFDYLSYGDGRVTYFLIGIDECMKETKSLQEQIDDITTDMIPDIYQELDNSK